MTDKLVIALAQMTQTMGDPRANADAMLEWRARAKGADLIVYPELQLIGYPPEDLVLKPALLDQANYHLDRLAQESADGGPAMLVGTVVASQGVLFNVVALIENGAVTAIRQKRELPNYGTFDEKRLFAPGPLPALDPPTLARWGACARAARARLLAQPDLLTQLMKVCAAAWQI